MNREPDYQFRSDEYDRPNRTWICGGEADGMPCPLGPTHQGQCRAVCTPRREGDRYYCNNASAFAGACDEGPLSDGSCCQMPPQCAPSKRAGVWSCNRGACQEGPLPDGSCSKKFEPCRPQRSVLARRGIATTAVFALAVSCLLIITSIPNPQRQGVVSPGKLTFHHRATANCQDCHGDEAGQGDLTHWVHAAFTAHADADQSTACLRCHAELGQAPMFAHGIAPDTLARWPRNVDPSDSTSSPSLLLALARNGRPDADQKLACATCHQEHRGSNYDMTHMSDLQCQVCHSTTFHGFSHGHPEFSSYPYSRRTRTQFDHSTHYGIHFSNFKRTSPRGVAPIDQHVGSQTSSNACAHCHRLDSGGNEFLVIDFQQSCGSCHNQQITDSRVKVVNIPVQLLAANTVAGAEQAVDEFLRMAWFERYETGFMRLLSAHESEYQTAKQVLLRWQDEDQQIAADSGVDDPSAFPPPRVRLAAGRYAGGLRRLLKDLLSSDPDALVARLTAAAFTEVSPDDGARLAQTLSLDLLTDHRRALNEIISSAGPVSLTGDVTEENSDESRGAEDVLDADSDAGDDDSDDTDSNGQGNVSQSDEGVSAPVVVPALRQWSLQSDDDVWTLTYRPQNHADELLRRWLETGARHCGTGSLNTFAKGEAVSPFEQVFAELSRPAASGRCMKCHTAQDDTNGRLRITWSADRARKFTDFVHAPHMPPLQNEKCDSCHRLTELSLGNIELYRSEFTHRENTINTNPFSTETSGFAPLEKSDCSKCHQRSIAGDGCLICHKYHVTSPNSGAPSARLGSLAKPE